MKRTVTLLASIFAMLVLVACSSPGGVEAPFSYGGNWSGTIDDSIVGKGVIEATFTQDGNNLGATWHVKANGDTINAGTALGIINGNEVALELYPTDPNLCGFGTLLARSGNTLTGTYSGINCVGTVGGTITLTKK